MYQSLLNNTFENNEQNAEVLDYFHPQTETLNFIRQFARTYHVESKLPPSLAGFILN